jgi:hypothetical protein
MRCPLPPFFALDLMRLVFRVHGGSGSTGGFVLGFGGGGGGEGTYLPHLGWLSARYTSLSIPPP